MDLVAQRVEYIMFKNAYYFLFTKFNSNQIWWAFLKQFNIIWTTNSNSNSILNPHHNIVNANRKQPTSGYIKTGIAFASAHTHYTQTVKASGFTQHMAPPCYVRYWIVISPIANQAAFQPHTTHIWTSCELLSNAVAAWAIFGLQTTHIWILHSIISYWYYCMDIVRACVRMSSGYYVPEYVDDISVLTIVCRSSSRNHIYAKWVSRKMLV